MKKNIALILVITLCLSACSQNQKQEPTSEVLETKKTEVVQDDTVLPSETPVPTIAPTEAPTITPTPRPTFSPETITIPAGDPINIGYLLWDSNPIGLDAVRGVEIAIYDYGAEILDHPIKLTGLNSECNEFAGQQGATILMQDKSIIGVIGTTCSAPALKAAPIISENNRVLISPSNSSPDLTASNTHSAGYARTAPNDLVQIKAIAHHAYDNLGARKMAIVRGEVNLFQRLYGTTLCEYFTELGGECVLEFAKYAGNTYVAPIINDLVEVEADAIYFLGWDFKEAAAFLAAVKDSEELKNTGIILWGEVYNRPGLLEETGDNALGVYVSATSYDIDWGSDQYQAFLSKYREDYGEEPQNIYHPYAYDAATLLLKAINEVAVPGDDGSLMVDPLAVRDATYNMVEFQGLSGAISCSPLGDCLSTAQGKVYEFISGDPSTFNPGPADLLSSNPVQVWP
jgi:branched-chain amino acid transport system substrate-binding protein